MKLELRNGTGGLRFPWDVEPAVPVPIRCARPKRGPLMLSHPQLRGGRPTNVNEYLHGYMIGYRLVPTDRDYTRVWSPERAASFEWVAVEKLHDEQLALSGRRPYLSVTEAARYREAYWLGAMTLTAIQAACNWRSTCSAFMLIHGSTYWYV